jgi:uncharacterized protein involved in copper resistance
MSRHLFKLRGLALIAGLLIGSAAALGQDQMPSEHEHGQKQSGKSADPEQQHSQHDMSTMPGMDHSAWVVQK